MAAVVQQTAGNTGTTATTSASFASNAAIGDIVVAIVNAVGGNAVLTSLTTSNSLVVDYWRPVAYQSGGSETIFAFFAVVTTAGKTVTANWAATQASNEIVILDVSGCSAQIDAFTMQRQTSAATGQPGTLTPVTNGCLLVAAAAIGNTTAPTAPGSPWTAATLQTGASDELSVVYQIQSTAAATSPSWTVSSTPTVRSLAFALQPTGSTTSIGLRQHQVAFGAASTTTVSTRSITPVAAGNMLIALATATQNLANGISISDGVNTWNRAVSITANENAVDLDSEVWYAMNIAAGAVSVTATYTSGTCVISLQEWSGLATTSALDAVTAAGSAGSSTAPATGSVTSTNANDLIIGAALFNDIDNYPTAAPTNSFASLTGGGNAGGGGSQANALVGGARIVSSTSTYSTVFTESISAGWVGAIAAFKAAPPAVATGQPPTKLPSAILTGNQPWNAAPRLTHQHNVVFRAAQPIPYDQQLHPVPAIQAGMAQWQAPIRLTKHHNVVFRAANPPEYPEWQISRPPVLQGNQPWQSPVAAIQPTTAPFNPPNPVPYDQQLAPLSAIQNGMAPWWAPASRLRAKFPRLGGVPTAPDVPPAQLPIAAINGNQPWWAPAPHLRAKLPRLGGVPTAPDVPTSQLPIAAIGQPWQSPIFRAQTRESVESGVPTAPDVPTSQLPITAIQQPWAAPIFKAQSRMPWEGGVPPAPDVPTSQLPISAIGLPWRAPIPALHPTIAPFNAAAPVPYPTSQLPIAAIGQPWWAPAPRLQVKAPVETKPLTSGAYQQAVIALSPLAFWPLNETSGTIINDYSGNGQTGTYQTTNVTLGVPPIVNDNSGNTAVQFTGAGSQFLGSIPNTALITPTTFTFVIWFRAGTISANTGRVASFSGRTTGSPGWELFRTGTPETGTIRLDSSTTTNQLLNSNTVGFDTNIHMLAVAVTGGTASHISIDGGAWKDSGAFTYTIPIVNLLFGNAADGSSNPATGIYQDAALFGSQLSQAQLIGLFQAGGGASYTVEPPVYPPPLTGLQPWQAPIARIQVRASNETITPALKPSSSMLLMMLGALPSPGARPALPIQAIQQPWQAPLAARLPTTAPFRAAQPVGYPTSQPPIAAIQPSWQAPIFRIQGRLGDVSIPILRPTNQMLLMMIGPLPTPPPAQLPIAAIQQTQFVHIPSTSATGPKAGTPGPGNHSPLPFAAIQRQWWAPIPSLKARATAETVVPPLRLSSSVLLTMLGAAPTPSAPALLPSAAIQKAWQAPVAAFIPTTAPFRAAAPVSYPTSQLPLAAIGQAWSAPISKVQGRGASETAIPIFKPSSQMLLMMLPPAAPAPPPSVQLPKAVIQLPWQAPIAAFIPTTAPFQAAAPVPALGAQLPLQAIQQPWQSPASRLRPTNLPFFSAMPVPYPTSQLPLAAIQQSWWAPITQARQTSTPFSAAGSIPYPTSQLPLQAIQQNWWAPAPRLQQTSTPFSPAAPVPYPTSQLPRAAIGQAWQAPIFQVQTVQGLPQPGVEKPTAQFPIRAIQQAWHAPIVTIQNRMEEPGMPIPDQPAFWLPKQAIQHGWWVPTAVIAAGAVAASTPSGYPANSFIVPYGVPASLVMASGQATPYNVLLPSATGSGDWVVIVRTNAGGNNVLVGFQDPSDTLNGSGAGTALTSQWQSLRCADYTPHGWTTW